MKLGAFSISLNVKDINASKSFYENLGFSVFGGDIKMNYLIMKNGNSIIGLFQGMFENNILTFNPGWDENANSIVNFDDVREIQKQLLGKGVRIENEIDTTSGPASLTLIDPDGNAILIDQHVQNLEKRRELRYTTHYIVTITLSDDDEEDDEGVEQPVKLTPKRPNT